MAEQNEMKKVIETVALIHVKDRKLLLVRAKSKNAFYMPGGKKEQGEDEETALVREIKEEIGVDIDKKTIKFVGIFEAQAYSKEEGVKVRINCYTASHKGKIRPLMEIAETAYFTSSEYGKKEETAPAVRLIFNALKEKKLID